MREQGTWSLKIRICTSRDICVSMGVSPALINMCTVHTAIYIHSFIKDVFTA